MQPPLKHKTSGPAHSKGYDGSRVIAHPVQAGENLSSISKIYLMPDWKPIWRYNIEIEHTLAPDPDLVRQGVTIFIPRSPNGYETLVKRLNRLRIDAEGVGDRLLIEQESLWLSLEAYKTGLDLVGDVATSLAGVALKGAAAIKATGVASVAKGQAKIAQRLVANASTREFAEAFAQIRGQRLRTALAAHGAARLGRAEIWRDVGSKAIGVAAERADQFVSERQGNDDAAWFGVAFKAMKTIGDLKAVKGGLDIVGVALDFVKPSAVADFLLLACTGESTTTTKNGVEAMIKSSTKASLALIDQQIAKYAAEVALIYPKR